MDIQPTGPNGSHEKSGRGESRYHLGIPIELSISVAIGNKLMRMSQSQVVNHVMVEKNASNSTENEIEDYYEGLPEDLMSVATFNKKKYC